MKSEIGQQLRLIIEDTSALKTEFAAAVEGVLLLYKDKDIQDKDRMMESGVKDGDYYNKKTASPSWSSSSCLIAVEETAVKEEEGMKTPTGEADRIPPQSECPGAPDRKKRAQESGGSRAAGVRRRSCRRKLTFKENEEDRRVLWFPR